MGLSDQVFDESSVFVTKKALLAKKSGCSLVAFFGDGTFGWFAPADICPLEQNFEVFSAASNNKQFLQSLRDVKQAARASRCGKPQYPARSLPQLAEYESEDEEEDYVQEADEALVSQTDPRAALEWLRCACRGGLDPTIKWGFGHEEPMAKATLLQLLRSSRPNGATVEEHLPEEMREYLRSVDRPKAPPLENTVESSDTKRAPTSKVRPLKTFASTFHQRSKASHRHLDFQAFRAYVDDPLPEPTTEPQILDHVVIINP